MPVFLFSWFCFRFISIHKLQIIYLNVAPPGQAESISLIKKFTQLETKMLWLVPTFVILFKKTLNNYRGWAIIFYAMDKIMFLICFCSKNEKWNWIFSLSRNVLKTQFSNEVDLWAVTNNLSEMLQWDRWDGLSMSQKTVQILPMHNLEFINSVRSILFFLEFLSMVRIGCSLSTSELKGYWSEVRIHTYFQTYFFVFFWSGMETRTFL